MTGNVWTGDVGDGSVEEIDILEKGKNYGWPFFEGDKQRSLEANWAANFPADAAITTCNHVSPSMACAAPALTYVHGTPVGDFTPSGTAAAIMGGLIPGTANWPEAYRKKYFFGDYAQSVVLTIDVNDAHTAVEPATVKTFMSAFAPTGFRMSPDGVLYLVSHGGGSVYTVTPKGGPLVPDPDPVGGAGGLPGLGVAGAEVAEGGTPGEPSGAGGAGDGVDSPSEGGVPSDGPGPSAEGGVQGGGALGGESSDPMSSGGDDGGCGCRVGRTTQSGAWAAIALALLWQWRRRRGQR
jgi:MYXO-CTERM domain-containing protein